MRRYQTTVCPGRFLLVLATACVTAGLSAQIGHAQVMSGYSPANTSSSSSSLDFTPSTQRGTSPQIGSSASAMQAPPPSSPQELNVPQTTQAAPQMNSGSSSQPILQKIRSANEKLEMVVDSSRILTFEKNIPRVVVNNVSILQVTALAPNQIQVQSLAPGVTQLNVFDATGSLFSIDVTILGDTRELSGLLESEFPNAALKVRAIANGVLISGFVENSDNISRINMIAEEYYPQVVMNVKVSGARQVLLHIKVIEVSRTKLIKCGFDWWQINSAGMVAVNGAGKLAEFVPGAGAAAPAMGAATIGFQAVSGNSAFFGVLEALRQDSMAKMLAEPTVVAYDGEQAKFIAGGEVPVQSGGGLGVPTNVTYKDYGTEVDFVPQVLGDGRIRLHVKPVIREIDLARSEGGNYAFKKREVNTVVELKAGQTLAIAGLLQTLIESEKKGIPWVSDVPYLGTMFRRVQQRENEVELLILVTPELVSAMDPEQVPTCGPGMDTTLPSMWEMIVKGYIEVPACCSVCSGMGCNECRGSGVPQLPTEMVPGMIGDLRSEGDVLEIEELQSSVPNLSAAAIWNTPRNVGFVQNRMNSNRMINQQGMTVPMTGPMGGSQIDNNQVSNNRIGFNRAMMSSPGSFRPNMINQVAPNQQYAEQQYSGPNPTDFALPNAPAVLRNATPLIGSPAVTPMAPASQLAPTPTPTPTPTPSPSPTSALPPVNQTPVNQAPSSPISPIRMKQFPTFGEPLSSPESSQPESSQQTMTQPINSQPNGAMRSQLTSSFSMDRYQRPEKTELNLNQPETNRQEIEQPSATSPLPSVLRKQDTLVIQTSASDPYEPVPGGTNIAPMPPTPGSMPGLLGPIGYEGR